MKSREKLRKYRELRRKWYGQTIVPRAKGSDMDRMRASMVSMDMTEDYLRFQAMNEDIPLPVLEGYIERTRRTREIAQVNAKAEALWRPYRKSWSFFRFIKNEYLVLP